MCVISYRYRPLEAESYRLSVSVLKNSYRASLREAQHSAWRKIIHTWEEFPGVCVPVKLPQGQPAQ